VRIVVLVRHDDEREQLASLRLANLTVPGAAVDSRSLVREADLMLGAGGTMTREAALMGIPTYSLFAGERPAVDRWLERHGMLRSLRSPDELDGIGRRKVDPVPLERIRDRSRAIEDVFVQSVLATADTARSSR
jgi:uncharacterized protein